MENRQARQGSGKEKGQEHSLSCHYFYKQWLSSLTFSSLSLISPSSLPGNSFWFLTSSRPFLKHDIPSPLSVSCFLTPYPMPPAVCVPGWTCLCLVTASQHACACHLGFPFPGQFGTTLGFTPLCMPAWPCLYTDLPGLTLTILLCHTVPVSPPLDMCHACLRSRSGTCVPFCLPHACLPWPFLVDNSLPTLPALNLPGQDAPAALCAF